MNLNERETMTEAEQLLDATNTALKAKEIIRAAVKWRWELPDSKTMNENEWRLFDAVSIYGDKNEGGFKENDRQQLTNF